MNIGLIDIDGHNFPNLALMKISAYHKSIGNTVSWYNPFEYFDIVYKSKVFTFTTDYQYSINADQIISGGTGYKSDNTIPDEFIQPDYKLYPLSKWYDQNTAYGFLTRGCPRKCKWCVVPKKEGDIKPYMDIEQVAGEFKKVILMDNNVLASDFGLQQIEKIVKLGLKVDFNQGLDARLITDDVAQLLGKVKWNPYLRMACDSDGMMEHVKKAADLLRKHNCQPKQYFVYVLLTDLESSYKRVKFCKENKMVVYGQPYIDFDGKRDVPKWQLDMARYTNMKPIFKVIDFKDYQPRKGFTCKEYFEK